MFQSFEGDRYYIERKYHDPEKPFNNYLRWNYHGYAYDASTGMDDEEMQAGLRALKAEIYAQPRPIQKAKLFAYVLDNARIDINEHDYFIGFWNWRGR